MREFINPYNFIPFGDRGDEKRRSREDQYSKELISGWLDVELEVKTPLIIPDAAYPRYYDPETGKEIIKPAEDVKRKLHKEYEFFHVNENGSKNYMIPGSGIRGAVRSMFEAITDSCVPFLMDDKPISQRVPIYGSVRNRWLLEYDKENDTWKLWSTYKTLEEADIKNYKDITISGTKYYCGDYIKDKGYVQCNVPVNTREKYHVAFLQKKETVYTWEKGDSEPYDKMRSVLMRDNVSGNGKNPNEEQAKHLLDKLNAAKKNGGMIPVRYFIVTSGTKEIVYMSNSSIGRIAQHRKWKQIIDKQHIPCEDTDKLCPACLLFGTVKGEGLKGRIRFTDALPVSELEFDKYLLEILGQPRTSAYEFYLEKPFDNATYWNFDFYGIKKTDTNGNTYTEYHQLDHSTPRGRKMYWHDKNLHTGVKRDRMNNTMEAVNKGVFNFKIYYDGISREQLDALIWTVTIGENDQAGNLWYKMGHGRPLGFGSVKMKIKKNTERAIKYSETEGLSVSVKETEDIKVKKVDDISILCGSGTDVYKNLIAICDHTKTEGHEVRYPRYLKVSKNGKQDDSIYQWFSNNHTNADRLVTLPYPKDSNITLKGSWNDDLRRNTQQVNKQAPVTRQDNRTEKRKEAGVVYEVIVTGYRNGKDGNPFFVEFRFDDGEKGSIPYFKLKKGNDATCIPKDSRYKLIYHDLRDNKWPDWKKA